MGEMKIRFVFPVNFGWYSFDNQKAAIHNIFLVRQTIINMFTEKLLAQTIINTKSYHVIRHLRRGIFSIPARFK